MDGMNWFVDHPALGGLVMFVAVWVGMVGLAFAASGHAFGAIVSGLVVAGLLRAVWPLARRPDVF